MVFIMEITITWLLSTNKINNLSTNRPFARRLTLSDALGPNLGEDLHFLCIALASEYLYTYTLLNKYIHFQINIYTFKYLNS